MSAFTRLAALVFLGLGVAGAQVPVAQLPRQTALSPQERATVEKLACGPLGVAATEVVGIRKPDAARPGATRADVKCAPHLRQEAVEAGYRVDCVRPQAEWSCTDRTLYLRRRVAGQGPFDFPVQGLNFAEAQAVVGCLEASLRDQPQLLGGTPLTDVQYLLRFASPEDGVTIGLMSGKRCMITRLNMQCTTAPPQRLVTRDCWAR
jgi:hypothetical protein